MKKAAKLIFEYNHPGRKGYRLPDLDVERSEINLPGGMKRSEVVDLPEVNEVDVVRHYTHLSTLNFGVDTGFYPLGSCTMKYNPKINEEIAAMGGFAHLHPLVSEEYAQGALAMMHELSEMLGEISGMDEVTLQPAAGAHGELTGLMLMKAYHEDRGDLKRTKIIVPDSAHGTNPASAAVAGFDVVEVKSNKNGLVDVAALKDLLSDEIAGLMLTNPNTLGLFEREIMEIAGAVHEAGGLLYYDGANMNAIVGKARPGDMGFDVMHFNLHKTFSTPHGGGGPGSGPVGVKSHLAPYLPKPVVRRKDNGAYTLDMSGEKSIGKVKGFYGHFGIMVRAYVYIKTLGCDGLKAVGENAVLNANYMMHFLKEDYHLPIDTVCKHEFVLSGFKDRSLEVTTLDVAKRIIDFGYHPPTIYFPLIVPEAMMIEPTETESRETLDGFIEMMKQIAREAKESPELLKEAPHHTPVRRIDEAKAARELILKAKDA